MDKKRQAEPRAPAHPGWFVKHQILDNLGLSVTDAAQALGITRPALSKFLNERADLSSDMALRIEKAFGVSLESLMNMQNVFDIAEARKRERLIKVPPFRVRSTNSKNYTDERRASK